MMRFKSKYSMRMTILASVIVVSGGGVASLAGASDGTITFDGKIQDVTCVISGGTTPGSLDGKADFTITLPNVSTSALKKSGERAGDTRFYIQLSGANCENGKIADVVFEKAQSTIDATTGKLINQITKINGGSENVQIAILNNDKTDINLNNSGSHQNVTIASNKALFEYWAQYYATGTVTAGLVQSQALYSISYN
ncbi:fimbrial protein [Erwinia billingiae]